MPGDIVIGPVDAYAARIAQEAEATGRNNFPPPGSDAERKQEAARGYAEYANLTREQCDENGCYTLENGECVSPHECLHSVLVDPKAGPASKKLPLQLVPGSVLVAIARSLEEGAGKYGAFNWRSSDGVEAMTYVGSVLRHLAAWVDGEELDPEAKNGKTHLEGAIGSLTVLIDAIAVGNMIDNRPPATNTGEQLRRVR